MTLNFQQTDSAASLGEFVACSGATAASEAASSRCLPGAIPGSNEARVSNPRDTSLACFMFEAAPNTTHWAAGTWTVRLNVTDYDDPTDETGTHYTLQEVHICRQTFNGAAVATVGSTTGISTFISANGVQTVNVDGAASYGSSSDLVYVVVVLDVGGGAGPWELGVTFDQIIETPIVPTRRGRRDQHVGQGGARQPSTGQAGARDQHADTDDA